MMPLALNIPSPLSDHLALVLAGAIVVIGLLVIGAKDVMRFSLTRAWAVASVCFRQSIRRRVLWITPLVMLGVVVVTRFQKPADAQDAIRQATVFCLFATGMLVVLVTIILACTNFPREIETRVIYTVATKPITRLEIVLGKVMGFASVSFWILLIMGVFTAAFLHLRNHELRKAIPADLSALPVSAQRTAGYYRTYGTIHARQFGLPDSVNIYNHQPSGPDDRWAVGATQGLVLAKFRIDRDQVPQPEHPDVPMAMGPMLPSDGGLVLDFDVVARWASAASTTSPATRPTPRIFVELRNAQRETMVTYPELGIPREGLEILPGGRSHVRRYFPPQVLEKWLGGGGPRDVYVSIYVASPDCEISAVAGDFSLTSPNRQVTFRCVEPISFGGRKSQDWDQFHGSRGHVAVLQFRNQKLPAAGDAVPFELRCGLEMDYGESREDEVQEISMDFVNARTGAVAKDIRINPENSRPSYFNVDASALAGGDFDVVMRLDTPGWLGLRGGQAASLRVVLADQSFAWNLLKSLFILWMLSVLVTIIAVFSSTFLSWPIAVVLTLLFLTGRWTVQQLGDMTSQPGIGRTIVQDLFKGSTAATGKAVSESVEAMVKSLNLVCTVLPDMGQFAAVSDLERGVAVSPATLLSAAGVLVGFGLPLLVLAYLMLKYKEVAP